MRVPDVTSISEQFTALVHLVTWIWLAVMVVALASVCSNRRI